MANRSKQPRLSSTLPTSAEVRPDGLDRSLYPLIPSGVTEGAVLTQWVSDRQSGEQTIRQWVASTQNDRRCFCGRTNTNVGQMTVLRTELQALQTSAHDSRIAPLLERPEPRNRPARQDASEKTSEGSRTS